MKEYIERAKLMDHIELNAREHEEDYDAWQILGDVEDFPAAKVIEAPCDIGDVFWRIDPVGKRVERVKVSGLTKKANGTWKIRLTCYYSKGVYEIVPSGIGKRVFRTEEEAEVALNERVH